MQLKLNSKCIKRNLMRLIHECTLSYNVKFNIVAILFLRYATYDCLYLRNIIIVYVSVSFSV